MPNIFKMSYDLNIYVKNKSFNFQKLTSKLVGFMNNHTKILRISTRTSTKLNSINFLQFTKNILSLK